LRERLCLISVLTRHPTIARWWPNIPKRAPKRQWANQENFISCQVLNLTCAEPVASRGNIMAKLNSTASLSLRPLIASMYRDDIVAVVGRLGQQRADMRGDFFERLNAGLPRSVLVVARD